MSKPPMLSYAQNGEDVVLSRVFEGQELGFYIDIGACDPVLDSVTLHFYERGWRGVNVEPDRELFASFPLARSRDANLCVAVGCKRGKLAYYPTGTRGHGTLDRESALDRIEGRPAERVPIMTLSDVIDCYGPDNGTIDFLKIDVEGWEAEVISSGDWTRHRPRVLLVEAVDIKGRPTHEAWESALLNAGYRFAVYDGLNRFYCRDEDAELMPRLRDPANPRDNWVRSGDARAHEASARLQIELASAEHRASEIAGQYAPLLSTVQQRLAEAEERSDALVLELEVARAEQSSEKERSNRLSADVETARAAEFAESKRSDGLKAELEAAQAAMSVATKLCDGLRAELNLARAVESAESEQLGLRANLHFANAAAPATKERSDAQAAVGATLLSKLYPDAYTLCDAMHAGVVDEFGVLPPGEDSPTPFNGILSTSETLFARGWAIDPQHERLAAGVILTLGKTCTEAGYGSERQDVATRYHSGGLTASGFRGFIVPNSEGVGCQEFRVFAVGIDGERAFPVGEAISVTIVAATVSVAIQTPLRTGFAFYHIDRGAGGRFNRGDTLEVIGWAYDRAVGGPVRGAFLVIGETNVVHGAVGLSRPDVAANLKDDERRSSGFKLKFNTLGLTAGIHRLRLGFVSADGLAQESFEIDAGLEILPPPSF